MTKEEIEQKLNKIINDHYSPLKEEDWKDMIKEAFNLGLQIASEVVDADLEIISEVAKIEMYGLEAGIDYEIGINRGSILQYKL